VSWPRPPPDPGDRAHCARGPDRRLHGEDSVSGPADLGVGPKADLDLERVAVRRREALVAELSGSTPGRGQNPAGKDRYVPPAQGASQQPTIGADLTNI
jgi:hypothetical protein